MLEKFKDYSIKNKLTLACVLTSMIALLVSTATFYIYEVRTLGSDIARKYSDVVTTLAPGFSTSIEFEDNGYANETLSRLGQNPDVLSAAIYDADGHLFASYVAPHGQALPERWEATGERRRLDGDDLFVEEPILSNGAPSGVMVLHAHISDLKERQLYYASLVAGVFGVSLITAVLFASVIVRYISRPIEELAATSRRISEERNYSLRAPKSTNDELGSLIDTFNEMLGQIQERDTQLEQRGVRLEGEVAFRTEEIQKLSQAVEQSPHTTVITNPEGLVEYVNQRFTDSTGYSIEEALSRDSRVVTTGMMPPGEVKKLMETLRGGGQWRGEFQNRRKDGTVYWESARVSPLRTGEDGKVSHYVWVKEDITERKRSTDALRESEDRYALAARGANDGLWDWDLRSDCVYFSPRWKAMIGFSEEEIGDSADEWLSRIHPLDVADVRLSIDRHLAGETPHFELEYRLKHKNESFVWVLSRGVSVRDTDGVTMRFAGSQTDITDRKRAEEKLFYDASHDKLTGLPNRGLLLERLGFAVSRAKRDPDSLFAVLFLDLDRFKIINDSLGHAAGDGLLIQASERIGKCVRDHDLLARLGGDEFAVLLEPIAHQEDAIRVAERIQEELSRPFSIGEHEMFTTASIGIALSSHGYEAAADVLRDSDVAMYRAKASGKARYAMFDTQLHGEALRRLQLESELRRAVDNEDFVLYYQPIFSVAAREIVGFEALVRWPRPDGGMVSPVEFIPIAEETGLITPMGWWILREACQQLVHWNCEYAFDPALTMNVNISGKQFLQADFVERVKEIVRTTGISGGDLKLEITETAIIENPSTAHDILKEFRALDVQFCIDDFGTGYSSLSYLHKFPFDVLKIDRSFVGSIDSDSEAHEIVSAIVAMSKKLNLAVTAEGVETEDQLRLLRGLDCEYAQGYLLAKPMPPPAVEIMLAARANAALPPARAAQS